MIEKIYKRVRNHFIVMSTILVTLLILIFLNHRANINTLTPSKGNMTIICLMASVIFSICIPILLRLFTFKKVKEKGTIPDKMYLHFNNSLFLSTFIGALCALYGYYILISSTLLTVTILCALYGVYSVMPSKKGLQMDFIAYHVENCTNPQ